MKGKTEENWVDEEEEGAADKMKYHWDYVNLT